MLPSTKDMWRLLQIYMYIPNFGQFEPLVFQADFSFDCSVVSPGIE